MGEGSKLSVKNVQFQSYFGPVARAYISFTAAVCTRIRHLIGPNAPPA